MSAPSHDADASADATPDDVEIVGDGARAGDHVAAISDDRSRLPLTGRLALRYVEQRDYTQVVVVTEAGRRHPADPSTIRVIERRSVTADGDDGARTGSASWRPHDLGEEIASGRVRLREFDGVDWTTLIRRMRVVVQPPARQRVDAPGGVRGPIRGRLRGLQRGGR